MLCKTSCSAQNASHSLCTCVHALAPSTPHNSPKAHVVIVLGQLCAYAGGRLGSKIRIVIRVQKSCRIVQSPTLVGDFQKPNLAKLPIDTGGIP